MKCFKITDFSGDKISKRELHPAGYLLLPDCVIARSGTLQYADVQCEDGSVVADGAVVTVYRPPQALKECVKYFNNLPLTQTHPEENSVDPNMVRDVIVGTLGSNARIVPVGDEDGNVFVVADIMIHDKEAIDAVQNGKFEQLSAGYETAYRKKRGVTKSGKAYEAEQFYLMPNHTALVENGRCGSECRVCDHEESTTQKENPMSNKRKGLRGMFRYFLANDSDDENVSEINEEVFNKLEQEGAPVEELDEDDVVLEENDVPGIEPEVEDEDDIEEDPEAEEEVEDEDDINPEDEEKPVDEPTADEGEIFEVQLDDGTIGKMDQAAFDYFSRYKEVQKKGDSAASIMKLACTAERVLGASFAIDAFISNDGQFDSRGLKKAIIKKQMPGIVVTSLKSDEAIDNLFESAVRSSKKNTTDWKADMMNLAQKPVVADAISPVAQARENRLNIINKRNK